MPAKHSHGFVRFPSIITVLEESADGACGLTAEGMPLRLVVAEPARLGTELIRATGWLISCRRSSRSRRDPTRKRSSTVSACRGIHRSCASCQEPRFRKIW